jgi:hypothetical protein
MSQVNEKIKKELLEGHFYYEFIQLFICMVKVRELNPDESKISVPNYIAVAFSTHARNLWEFFYASDSHPQKRPRVNHYIKDWNIVANSQISKYYGVLNKQLSHLDYGRTETKEPPPVAFIYGAYRHFRLLVKEFLDKLPKEIPISNLDKLREIIKDDMSNYP